MVEGDTLEIDRLLQNLPDKAFIPGRFQQEPTALTPDSGHNDFLKSREQLSQFQETVRQLIVDIGKAHGKNPGPSPQRRMKID